MGNKLYVGNLDFQTTAEDLTELFAGAGEVARAQVIVDRDTQHSKGFAFVEMVSPEDAAKAISMYNGHALNGRALVVNEARPREERAGSSSFSRGGSAGAMNRPKFREVKHKQRGGRKARNY